MYTWYHNQVLKRVADLVASQCERINKQLAVTKELRIHFNEEGEHPLWQTRKKDINMRLLSGAYDWRMTVDLNTSLHFPVHIIQTN